MAQIAESGGGDHGKKGKKRAKKGSTHVDMTPMVDLAFLLLTFFVLTSTFSKPKVMPLNYPAKLKDPTFTPPKVNNAATFILSGDKVYYYRNEFYSKAKPGPNGPTVLEEANFGSGENSVRKLLASWNEYVIKNKVALDKQLDKKQIADTTYERKLNDLTVKREAVKVLIKTDDKALCKSFVDLVDELKIANVGVIAPTDLSPGEKELLKEKN